MDKRTAGWYALVSASIYLEGGGDSKELHIRCREGFRKLFENCGFRGRMPRLYACGGRNSTYGDFRLGHCEKNNADYVAMLIDSEDQLDNLEAVWTHLEKRDGWDRPEGAEESQVLLMTTCMETWIIADRKALSANYGGKLQNSALSPPDNLEQRSRYEIQESLFHATRNCPNSYEKGKRSFEILAKLSPDELEKHLPSFARTRRILNERLKNDHRHQ